MQYTAATRENSIDLLLAEGRGELAASRFAPDNPHCDGHRLLSLLWHEDREIRRLAVSALAGGDLHRAYSPHLGHFVGSVGRSLMRRCPEMPASPTERLNAVSAVICEMLEQSSHDIRGLSNMNYSFLSSALYLALFSTCRDALEAARRLKLVRAQAPVTRLLWHLSTIGKTLRSRRLSGQDAEAMALMAGRMLAVLPASAIPDFWHNLSDRHLSRKRAVLPVLCVLHNTDAVPYLLDSLPHQPTEVTLAIIDCLGRLGDPRALPALLDYGQSRNKVLRKRAQTAILDIEKAHSISPAKTLVRPVSEQVDRDPARLLRSLSSSGAEHPPEQMLRSFEKE